LKAQAWLPVWEMLCAWTRWNPAGAEFVIPWEEGALGPVLIPSAAGMSTQYVASLWLVSGAVVLVLAAGGCLLLHDRSPSPWTDYLLGAAAWTSSVALKVVAAVFIFGALRSAYGRPLSLPVLMPATGLLTGVFECGVTLAVALLTRLRCAGWNSAVAFGVGFGCFEAVALAAAAVLRGIAGLSAPAITDESTRRQILASMGAWYEPLQLVLDRAISVPVHALATVWIVEAVRARRQSPFWKAFLLKSGIDALPAGAGLHPGLLEILYLLFGLGSLLGLRRARASSAWESGTEERTRA
jgi:uncharacterized membrane protein YhfC